MSPPRGQGTRTPIANAVVREVREETGLEVRSLRAVWVCPADGADYDLYWWLAEPVGGELRYAPDEVAEAQWLRPEEFSHLDYTFPGGREFFEHVLPTLPEWKR